MTHSNDSRRQQVVRLAFELQHQEHSAAERKAFDDALENAAIEDGMSPELLARAEAELARRETEAAEHQLQRRKRLRRLAAAAAVVVGVGAVGGWISKQMEPRPPFQEGFNALQHWGLHHNPESRASFELASESGRDRVAKVSVEAFGASQNGKYFVNLDSSIDPVDFSGYNSVSVDMRGTLPTARLYLEMGTDERWRSPPLDLGPDWRTFRLSLESFERQVRHGHDWRTESWKSPGRVHRFSVKVGHFVNPVDAKGYLEIDALKAEAAP